MSSNVFNPSAFLRTSRTFPQEAQPLSVEIDKAYVDTANAVNARIVGLYPTTKAAITGESWFISSNQKQQTLRQIFTFSAVGAFNHNLGSSIQTISPKSYGQATDGTNWYGVLFGSSVAIAGQYSFYVTTTQIVILAGGGSPAFTSGFIVLEWLTNV